MRRPQSAVSGTKRKRRTTKKKVSGTRRRSSRKRAKMGAVNVEDLAMTALAAGAGAVAARESYALVSKIATVTPEMFSFIQIGAGAAAMVFLGQKNKFVYDMGLGAVAFGVQDALVNMGIISGIGAMQQRTRTYRINGTNQLAVVGATKRNLLPAVGGTNQLSVVAGRVGSVPGPHNNRVSNPRPSRPTKVGVIY